MISANSFASPAARMLAGQVLPEFGQVVAGEQRGQAVALELGEIGGADHALET